MIDYYDDDDVRQEFLQAARRRRWAESNCQGRPICGCHICEPENFEEEDEECQKAE